jgi:hypothetical protein
VISFFSKEFFVGLQRTFLVAKAELATLAGKLHLESLSARTGFDRKLFAFFWGVFIVLYNLFYPYFILYFIKYFLVLTHLFLVLLSGIIMILIISLTYLKIYPSFQIR